MATKEYYWENREARLKADRERYHTNEADFMKRKVRCWKKNYGIEMTLEEYNRRFLEQKGRCVICGKHQSELKKALAVDHNHKTGEVRSLLCNRCNLLVGQLECQSENRNRCQIYLDDWNKKKLKIV